MAISGWVEIVACMRCSRFMMLSIMIAVLDGVLDYRWMTTFFRSAARFILVGMLTHPPSFVFGGATILSCYICEGCGWRESVRTLDFSRCVNEKPCSEVSGEV